MNFKLPDTNELNVAGHQLHKVNEKYNVWTRRMGSLDNKISILFVHGGPGGDSTLFQVFEDYVC